VSQPNTWEQNKGDPGFSDKTLSNVQFAAALLAAFEAGQVKDRRPLELAARKLIAEQATDGAWRIEPDSALGSPTTWGTTLTTFLAAGRLKQIDRSAPTGSTLVKRGDAEQCVDRGNFDNGDDGQS
jgi:hypothetical protein